MTHLTRRSLILIAALAGIAESAYGQICVTSDSSADTACGTNTLTNGSSQGGNTNSAFGAYALDHNTKGNDNTASGVNALIYNTTGSYNTAAGVDALFDNTTGSNNTAAGVGALQFNATGSNNTASGYEALYGNTTGEENTASGVNALLSNTSGNDNTASGVNALSSSVGGSGNTAIGWGALQSNNGSTGYNTAVGFNALTTDPVGNYSTAVGAYSLASVTSGSIGYNTGFGAFTLNANTSGSNNTAFGYAALRSTTTGNNNIGFGYQSLYLDATGSNNIAMGYQAAYNLASGSNTIEIGNAGAASDNDLVRIGTQGVQKSAFMAGIYGNTLTGSAVYVTASGELGVMASSERYKTEVQPMGAASDRLAELRPVTFKLKSDPNGTRQYGLIAEEVDKVYPELVIRDNSGKIQGVHYEELAPMLLAEVQKQQATIRTMSEKQDTDTLKIDAQAAEIRDLKKLVLEMQAGLFKLQAKDQTLAQR